MQSRSRNALIDWLRGFSILMVAASHGALTFPNYLTSPIAGLVKGYFGVSLFFVISGFLITRNTFLRYASLENVNIGQFYVMRIARIIPPLLLFLATALMFFIVRNSDFVPADHTLVWSGVYSAITFQFHSFYLTGNVPGMYAWSPLWSLSIEEIFYFIFPVVCFLSIRTWVFVVGCAALIVCGPWVRQEYFGLYNFWGNADLLAWGCLGAILERYFSLNIIARILAPYILATGASIALLTIIYTDPTAQRTWAPSTIGIGTGAFLIGACMVPKFELWRVFIPPALLLRAFGTASYEIYLFHVIFIVLYHGVLQKLFGVEWPVSMQATYVGVPLTVTFLAMVLGFGTVVSRYFSEPLNRKIRAFYEIRRPFSSDSENSRAVKLAA